VLDEVPGHVLEAAGDVLADAFHWTPALGAHQVGRLGFDVVHLPLDVPGAPSGPGLPLLPGLLRLSCLGLFDLAVELGILSGLVYRIAGRELRIFTLECPQGRLTLSALGPGREVSRSAWRLCRTALETLIADVAPLRK